MQPSLHPCRSGRLCGIVRTRAPASLTPLRRKRPSTSSDPVSIPAPDGHERRSFGDLTVDIDRTLCVGFGDCIELGPDLFEFDDEGIVRFREGCEVTARDTLIAACGICPVDALVVYDGGVRIVP